MQLSLVINGCSVTTPQVATLVPWWSLTKTVLAATALTLVRDGFVGLDEPVAHEPFTLRQLLRHESGLADYSEMPEYYAAVSARQRAWPAAEMLERLEAGRLRYAPGADWRYSNVGYMYVGQLIERLTGQPLADALAQRVLNPLGASRTRLATTAEDLASNCQGTVDGYDPGWVYHGLLVGPLEEAALCLDHLLAGQILPAPLLREMRCARPLGGPIAGRPWTSASYALGLMQGGIVDGLLLTGHTGGGPDSLIGVYQSAHGELTATCAVHSEGADQGSVEDEVVRQLVLALGVNAS